MRAAVHVKALLELFDVTLAIINCGLSEADTLDQIPAYIRRGCASILVVNQPSRYDKLEERISNPQARILLEAIWPTPISFTRNTSALAQLAAKLAGKHFDVIHCYRLRTSKLIMLLRKYGITYSRSVLDVDDYESVTSLRFARRFSYQVGKQQTALRFLEAAKMAVVEEFVIPRFMDGYACSQSDKEALERRFPHTHWTIVPNTLPLPPPLQRVQRDAFTFIFVGGFGYLPNRDAVNFFCNSILPILRNTASHPFRVLVAGRNPSPSLMQLAQKNDVEVVANPPSIGPIYAQADAAIIPIRAGGGTRIKILEAFSYGLPVVSTRIGAEGLQLVPGTHALIADSPQDFAESCNRLIVDDTLRKSLGAAGHDLFRQRFSEDILVDIFRATLCTVPEQACHPVAKVGG
jgi:glycosyltransferase involved in cell wall biosynthesis